jgi:hypothetical protein
MPGYADGAGGDEFAVFRMAAAEMEGWAAGPDAAGLDHAGLEKEASRLGRELVRLVIQAHLDLRAAREERLPGGLTAADGSARTRAEQGHTRSLMTVAGPVTVTRTGYRAPGEPIVYRADDQLRLPAGKYSLGLRELAAAEAAGGSFEAGMAAVARATGVAVPKRQFEELTRSAAADFASFYAARSRQAPALAPGDVLMLQPDGKGIRMLPGWLRPEAARLAARAAPRQDGRLSRGEVRTRKRMAEVGSVSVITPVPRTASALLAGRAGTPKARDKWLTASVERTAAQVIAEVFAEASRRDPGHQMPWIALADGNKDQLARIRDQAAASGIDVPVIIDFVHVTEYLWNAAWCFFPEASPRAAPWVRVAARAILDGRAPQVTAAIRARATGTGSLSAARRKAAEKTARYLESKAPYLDYPRALKAGWPIATGVIEGACRHLVKDRMDITGARWSTPGAEAILKLRAIITNGDWDDYWTWHAHQEHRRTHRNHQNSWELAA